MRPTTPTAHRVPPSSGASYANGPVWWGQLRQRPRSAGPNTPTGPGRWAYPLGEPGTVEHPRPGEVIYEDAKGVLTRHWNHRDADRTKVTEDSGRIVFLLETTGAPDFGSAVEAAAGELAALLGSRSRRVATHWITPATPLAKLQE